MSKIAENSQ